MSISVGGSQSKQEGSQQQETQHFGSQLTAGKTTLKTTAGDLNITGSSVNAKHIHLDSAGEINLTSAQDSSQSQSHNKNSGWSVGVFAGYNGNSSTLNNDEYTSLDMYVAEATAFDKANGNLLTKTLQPKIANNLYVSSIKNGADKATKAALFALNNPQQVSKAVAYSLSECMKSGIDCLSEKAK